MVWAEELDTVTGLYHSNARWYDPTLGRFLTEDPARDGDNWYAYAGNNPLTHTDPTGLDVQNPGRDQLPGPQAPAVQQQVVVPQVVTPPAPAGALTQNDPALAAIGNMAASGCDLRSCQMVAEADTGQALTAIEIAASVTALQANHAVESNMTVNNPDTVIGDAFTRLGHAGTTATVNWGGNGMPNATLIRGTTPNGNPHYRYGDTGGNVLWDPFAPPIGGTVTTLVLPVYIHRPNAGGN